MECSIVIRPARSSDGLARGELVRRGFSDHNTDAFILFYFQEVTLQAVVLVCAVLFIFCGASGGACALVVPLAALVVALAVRTTHAATAHTHARNINKEMLGYVAEVAVRGGGGELVPGTAAGAGTGTLAPSILLENEYSRGGADSDKPCYKQVVGTVSVSEFWGPGHSGWLHDLAVHHQWRRRGVARALVGAARRGAARAGLASLEAVASELQGAARTLLHEMGWECRSSYHRPLAGSLLTLQMAQLGTDLPHA